MTVSTVTVSTNWMASLEAIAEALRAQVLRDVGYDVQVQRDPIDLNQIRPGVYVTPTSVQRKTGTVSRDDIGYGCQISVIGGTMLPRGHNPERITSWQEDAARLFNNKRLGQVAETYNLRTGDFQLGSKVEDAPVGWDAVEQQGDKLESAAIVVRVWVREART